MFTLGRDLKSGRRETYGINVFKVREVMRVPEITRSPDMPDAVEGMVSLRGALVPVIDLAKYVGVAVENPPSILIVSEYNGHTQGFLVEGVDNILRLDWASMHVPPEMLNSQKGGVITAVTELPDRRLVMMMDVEKVLAEAAGFKNEDELIDRSVSPLPSHSKKTVFFADDSSVARRQIQKTLDAMGVGSMYAVNGARAWEELRRIADVAASSGKEVNEFIQVVLTDVEMPEMDGYMLTRKIKEDRRFKGIPVLMHSSLSSDSNVQLGKTVGVDEYVPKFEPQKLAQTLARLLSEGERHV